MLEILDFTGRAVASKDDLLVALVQRVEGVEELLLDALFSRQKLDVVNEQQVGLAVFLAESGYLVVLDAVNIFVGEFLRSNENDARALFVTGDELADGMEQMSLAQSDTAVKEEGIIRFAGAMPGSTGGCEATLNLTCNWRPEAAVTASWSSPM